MSLKNLYIEYWRIGKTEYWQKVNYFEEKLLDFSTISFEEKHEIELDYLNSVFEIGKYEKYLKLVDPYIKDSLENNPKLFVDLLVKKSAAYFNIDNISEAKNIAEQALSLNPDNRLGQSVLLQCFRNSKSPNYKTIRAISNFLLLISAGSIVVDWLLVAPFYPDYTETVTNGVQALVTMTVFILLINELNYYFRGRKEWRNRLKKLRLRNANKKNKNKDVK